MYFLPSQIIRKLDSETIASGVPGELLMERAGYGAYKFLKNVAIPNAERFLIFAGKGNNAGDAFVIARYLLQAGKFVEMICFADYSDYQGDAAQNLQKLLKLSPRISVIRDEKEINSFDWHGDVIVDGILGTGICGEVKGIFLPAIQKINELNIPVLALDIPSGLNCDTGEICGAAVKAKWTTTFANPKYAVLTDMGARHCGRVEVIDIGVPNEITEKYKNNSSTPHFLKGVHGGFQSTSFVDCQRCTGGVNQQNLSIENLKAHKNNFGHLLIIAGSSGMTGAAILSAKAAISSGAGLVTIAIPSSLMQLVASSIPCSMTLPLEDEGKGFFIEKSADGIIKKLKKYDAVALGPGIGTNTETADFISKLIPGLIPPLKGENHDSDRGMFSNLKEEDCGSNRGMLIIDADALNIIAKRKELLQIIGKNVVLTPHPGEFERLSGMKPDGTDLCRISAAKDFIKNKKLTLLLKGFHTVIANSKSENIEINLTGNQGMATAGSGDVLTGIIGAFLAMGFSTENAASCGAFIHGLAGDIAAAKLGENSVTAEEIIKHLGKAFLYL